MARTHNNKFASLSRKRLIDLNWSISDLAARLKRPRSTVSTAIHTQRFPLVRGLVAKKLNLEEAA